MMTLDVLAALERDVELDQIGPELEKLKIEIPASFITKVRSLRQARDLAATSVDAA